jgi:hypothetical protein
MRLRAGLPVWLTVRAASGVISLDTAKNVRGLLAPWRTAARMYHGDEKEAAEVSSALRAGVDHRSKWTSKSVSRKHVLAKSE